MTFTIDVLSDDWRGVMRMYAAYRRMRSCHPDLADFHARRYAAYCELLGIELDETPTGQARYPHGLLLSFADAFPRLHSPFAGFLEVPKAVIEVYDAHGKAITAQFAELEERYLDVMVDCATRVWGPCPHRVTAQELGARGVGRAHEPDEFDHL